MNLGCWSAKIKTDRRLGSQRSIKPVTAVWLLWVLCCITAGDNVLNPTPGAWPPSSPDHRLLPRSRGRDTVYKYSSGWGTLGYRVTWLPLSSTIMHAIVLPAPAKKQKRSVFSHFGSVYIPCLKSNNCHTCPKMSKWVYNSIHTVFWRFCCLTSLIMYLKNTPSISLRPQYRPA